jgi:arylsulfatase A-like enzyme
MDFLPTFIRLAGGSAPPDRIIDGNDIRPLMFEQAPETTQPRAFFYYFKDNIEAVRLGKWKLHIRKGNQQIRALYNLKEDIGEKNNLHDKQPDIVQALQAEVKSCREDIGDQTDGIEGANCRPIGRTANPETLTHYNRDSPYLVPMYDLKDAG